MSLRRIVVDPLMMEALNGSVARLAVAVPCTVPQGTPVFIDGMLPPCTGYVEHNDGRIEKFGKWPAPQGLELPEDAS